MTQMRSLPKQFWPVLFVALVASILQSCGTTGPGSASNLSGYTDAQRAYLDRSANSPLDFIASKERSDEAWGRGEAFLGRFATLRIQFATDYVMQAQPPDQYSGAGFSFTRSPKGDSSLISISTLGVLDSNASLRLEHVAAYYMLSEEEPPHDLFANLESIELTQTTTSNGSNAVGWVLLGLLGALGILYLASYHP